jgi:NAD(P)-dependent dehydrogenase (short-subunit alcohol dehydrogenase family)
MSTRQRWSAQDMPDLTGIRAVVTGANSGLGRATVRELARHGAEVTLAVRDLGRGEEAIGSLRAELQLHPLPQRVAGDLVLHPLDLADLSTVRAFAAQWSGPLHLLVNNAGVMAIPRRETTDGFEMQLGTNHLGHFALTGLLLPHLQRTGVAGAATRIVTVSSGAHRMGKIDFADLQGARSYRKWRAYGQSKLANLLFTFELQRRLEAAGLSVGSFAAHPGYASTNLQSAGPKMSGSRLGEQIMKVANGVLGQSAEQGALPTLYAATCQGLPPGSFIGPDGPAEQRGHPRLVGSSTAARDEQVAARLWTVSEDLTGVNFPFDALSPG